MKGSGKSNLLARTAEKPTRGWLKRSPARCLLDQLSTYQGQYAIRGQHIHVELELSRDPGLRAAVLSL